MATFTTTWYADDTSGTVAWKVRYRLTGDDVWSSFLVVPSGSTATFQGHNNRIYDVQVQNLNNSDNAISRTSQNIGFSDPLPIISPTNISVGYSFNNLSVDIDYYSTSIALYSSPGIPLANHTLDADAVVTDTFTGLTPVTQYILSITPVANQFSQTFTYTFTTEELASCADPQDTIATLS